jgi:serine/threonine-protein kinase
LGNGHFGVVFLGEDNVHGQVAAKVIERKVDDSDDVWLDTKTAFLTEAKNLSKATHRNIVQVHHIEELPDGNSIRFCMAFCSGGSLQTAYETGPMELSAVRKAGTEVLMGLSVVHARGMLHRDIKPANILLDHTGTAKIGDFGLVTDKLIAGYGSVMGYRDHIAFEVWHGSGTSIKSDIWAFGMTLYRLIHGQVWYEQAPALQTSVSNGKFANGLKWLPHVPKAWRRTIRKMLNDDPGARYQSADQTLNALSALPTAPSWATSVTGPLVRWERIAKDRKIVVEWKRHSKLKQEWVAWSEPLGQGRKMTLAGSNGVVNSSVATSGLERFFDV